MDLPTEVCLGCGSTKTLAEIKAAGHISCCPERKMVTPEYKRAYEEGYANGQLNPRKGINVQFSYKNHRALVEVRDVILTSIDYFPLPNNDMGYPPGWCLTGFDMSRGRDGSEIRSFFQNNIQLPEAVFRQPSNNHPYRIKLA